MIHPTLTRMGCGAMVAVGLWGQGARVSAEPLQSTNLSQQVQGTVSAVSRQGIAVEQTRTATTASETYLPFDVQVQLQGVRSVEELHDGDTVLVEYRETFVKDAQGRNTTPSRVAIRVTLVSRAPKPLAVPEDVHESTDATASRHP